MTGTIIIVLALTVVTDTMLVKAIVPVKTKKTRKMKLLSHGMKNMKRKRSNV